MEQAAVEIKIPKRLAIGDIMVRRGTLTRAQLSRALQEQAHSMLPLASCVLRLGFATERELLESLSEHFGVPGVDLAGSVIGADALALLPQQVARSHHLLPLEVKDGSLKVAMNKPDLSPVLDEIAFATGCEVLPFVAVQSRLMEAIEGAYEARSRGDACWAGSGAIDPNRPHIEEVIAPAHDPGPSMEVDMPEVAGLSSLELPAPKPRPKDAPPRVLAVDDEEAILDLIDTALSKRGLEVVRATRGREALEILQQTQPDLVLLDAMLPEIHGFELCSTIKKSERFKGTPVIIISAIYTGWSFAEDVKRLYGADDYLEKPFRIVELVRRVDDILGRQPEAASEGDLQQTHRMAAVESKRAAEFLKAGLSAQAEEAARRATQLAPFDARAHFILGTALQAQGKVYQAISEFERVVEISPTLFSALKNLAVLYERQGFKGKAVETWMRALAQSPNDAVRHTIKAHLIALL